MVVEGDDTNTHIHAHACLGTYTHTHTCTCNITHRVGSREVVHSASNNAQCFECIERTSEGGGCVVCMCVQRCSNAAAKRVKGPFRKPRREREELTRGPESRFSGLARVPCRGNGGPGGA